MGLGSTINFWETLCYNRHFPYDELSKEFTLDNIKENLTEWSTHIRRKFITTRRTPDTNYSFYRVITKWDVLADNDNVPLTYDIARYLKDVKITIGGSIIETDTGYIEEDDTNKEVNGLFLFSSHHIDSVTDIENIIKHNLLSNILNKNYADVISVHTAEWINRLTNDAKVTAEHFAQILPDFIEMAVRLCSALLMIIVLDNWFIYILIPGGVVLFLLTYAFRRILQRLHKNIQEQDGKLRIFLQEYIGSLMMIKSFCAETLTITKADYKMQDHKIARMKRNHFSNICNIGFSIAMNGIYILGVTYCAHGIITGTVTYGTLTAIMQLIAQIQSPFANISVYIPRYYAMIASAERLMYAEKLANETDKFELNNVLEFYNKEFLAVKLENISFNYKDTNVFKNLSLEINKGDCVAFIGHSGCGKSTILKLLMCMYPLNDGKRLIMSSKQTQQLTEAWRRLFAYVPQDNTLIHGSIRDIVSFSKPESADDNEKIQRALKIACADEFIDNLDLQLGEKGSGLSWGQMQRIAIARAVFSESPILLLDEATSALDEETEKKLLDNLKNMTNYTIIFITHREVVLSICNRIFNFSENGVIER